MGCLGRSKVQDMVKQSALVVLVLLVAGVVGLLWRSAARPNVTQPIAYSHKKHIDEGLECHDCHQTVLTRAVAGRPKEQTCLDCHDPEELEDGDDELSPEMVKLLTYLKNEERIPWRRLYRVPEHVYFSHVRHVGPGEVACETCHGPMAQAERPPRGPLVRLTMNFCLECHAQRQAAFAVRDERASHASSDCNACHR